MSKKATISNQPRHPQGVKLSEAVKEDSERLKAQKGLFDKKATLIKAPGTDAEGETGGVFTPSQEQLDRINQFTRRAVSADEVVAFDTLSCNNIPDRDDDVFTTECVKGFAALEQPFSPVGKSYMVDHEYKIANAVGRIFGVDLKTINGSLFLTNEVYIPNTEKNKGFIEDLEFGVNWAVSVGVMLGKQECSLSFCKAPFSSWGYWCQNGHDKGYYYTEDAEEDGWGFPIPSDASVKGAEKCLRNFDEPKDFYELSQVFLGAQYFAALEKEPDFAGVMKSAVKGVPTIGLSKAEALKLPLRHEPEKLSEARIKYEIREVDDGSLVWTDEDNLIWTFDPQNPDDGVMSLGKASSNDNEEEEDGTEELDEHDEGDDGSAAGSGSGAEEQQDGSRSVSDQSEEGSDEQGSESGEVTDAADEDEEEEEEMSKQAVLTAAAQAQLDQKHIEAAKEAEGNGLLALLSAVTEEVADLRQKVSGLESKATLGEAYIKELRGEALDWYVKARATSDHPKVSVEAFVKLLDRVEDDVDLFKSIIEEQKELAQAKFPKSVRRSSFPSDANSAERLSGSVDFGDESDEKVKRLHG